MAHIAGLDIARLLMLVSYMIVFKIFIFSCRRHMRAASCFAEGIAPRMSPIGSHRRTASGSRLATQTKLGPTHAHHLPHSDRHSGGNNEGHSEGHSEGLPPKSDLNPQGYSCENPQGNPHGKTQGHAGEVLGGQAVQARIMASPVLHTPTAASAQAYATGAGYGAAPPSLGSPPSLMAVMDAPTMHTPTMHTPTMHTLEPSACPSRSDDDLASEELSDSDQINDELNFT